MGANFHCLSTVEMRQQFAEVFTDVIEGGKAYYITEEGRARAVLVNVDRYHAMMDALEDFGGEGEELGEEMIASVLQRRQES